MTAFEWGMLGLFLFFSLVTFWCLYSYRANQKLSGQGKPQAEEWEGKHESKSQK
ncbi:putative membrane protein [Vibrio cholerae]|nr:putative membrane protein [Vibrio cholerae]GIB50021.1 putative membrane protein [Vibrio cholerae]